MSDECKYCYTCNNYCDYYVKGDNSLYKKTYGDCLSKHGAVNRKNTCAHWTPRRDNDTTEICLAKLEKLTDQLTDLIFIIKSNFDKE